MAKSKTTNATTTTTYTLSLLLTTVFLVALPSLRAQPTLSPTAVPVAPGPEPVTMAPSPGVDCFSYLLNLSDCLGFVNVGSNLIKPDKGCCPELSNLISTQPICLCRMLSNPNQFQLNVDINRALKLPSVCKTPPVSLCSVLGVPVGAPAPAPSEGSSSISGGPGLAGGPAATPNPAPGNAGNGSPRNLASTQHFLVGLAIILFANLF